jgi:hypothetical protein
MAFDLELREIKEKYFSFIAKHLNIEPNNITHISFLIGIISTIFIYFKFYYLCNNLI